MQAGFGALYHSPPPCRIVEKMIPANTACSSDNQFIGILVWTLSKSTSALSDQRANTAQRPKLGTGNQNVSC